MDIFVKGGLSKREMQIALLIIRESWGWDKGTSNWTKRVLSNRYISEKTGLAKQTVCVEIKSMIEEQKVLVNESGQYSFNEHPETWKFIKHELSKPKKVHKTLPESSQNVTFEFINHYLKVHKTLTFDGLEIDVSTISMKDLRALLKVPKESIKEMFKEIFKESVQALRDFYEQKITKLRTFDDTRKRMIQKRLEVFSLNELKQVITNISNSDWHMGRDPKTNGKTYYDFERLFKNNGKTEYYLNMKGGKSGAHKKTDPSSPDKFTKTGFSEIPEPRS